MQKPISMEDDNKYLRNVILSRKAENTLTSCPGEQTNTDN